MSPNPSAILAPAIASDVTEQSRLLSALTESFPGGICLFDKDLRMVLCNAEQKRLLDYPDELFASQWPTLEQIFRFNAERGEYGPGEVEEHVSNRMAIVAQRRPHIVERTRPNGTVLEIRGTPLEGGGFVTTYLDVTEQRRAQALAVHLAHHDAMTGLANRMLFMDRLRQSMARAKRGHRMAVLYIDLDRFKPVNDRLGHAAGDAVLKRVAERLRSVVRETDTVARLGGDEFVVIQCGTASTLAEPSSRVASKRRSPHPYKLRSTSLTWGPASASRLRLTTISIWTVCSKGRQCPLPRQSCGRWRELCILHRPEAGSMRTVAAMRLAEHLDHVILITGDGDFRALVAAIQQRGRRVSVVSTLQTQPPMVADELRRQADQFIDLADLEEQICSLYRRPVRCVSRAPDQRVDRPRRYRLSSNTRRRTRSIPVRRGEPTVKKRLSERPSFSDRAVGNCGIDLLSARAARADPVCVEKPDGRGEDRVLYRMTDMEAKRQICLCVSPG